jgi:hypothetical protein
MWHTRALPRSGTKEWVPGSTSLHGQRERERETVDTGVSSGNGQKQTCKGPCYTPVPRKSSSATAPGTGAGAGAASGTGTGVGSDAGAVGEAEAEAEEGIAAMMTYALSSSRWRLPWVCLYTHLHARACDTDAYRRAHTHSLAHIGARRAIHTMCMGSPLVRAPARA